MTDWEAMRARHSVRAFTESPIPPGVREELDDLARRCSEESGLRIFLRYDDPAGFDSRLAHYGSFRNVANYIVIAGRKERDFDVRCGYYGEKLVLLAQKLGLNSCWAALTFNRKWVREQLREGESLGIVIALGYGRNQGRAHKSKGPEQVSELRGEAPEWFQKGVEAALLAPTAVNQQKFCFGLEKGEPTLRVRGLGSCTRIDLGIVALHFELASGRKPRIRE